jgi:predicted dithiol-disulfide oxidoreductase (DUF899 family)
VEKEYVFQGADGKRTLAQLFDDRKQLVVYHAMFNPDTAGPNTSWTKTEACFVCTWWMDNFDRMAIHLNHRDVTIAAAAYAPFEVFEAYRKRMGWSFPVYSSRGSDFNFDYAVSFTPQQVEAGKAEYNYREDSVRGSEGPGVSVFIRDGDRVYHTYSAYARGLDMLNVGYHYLDIVPKGRDEGAGAIRWLHRRDEYPD